MRRREFITLASSAAIAWPLAARAQQLPVIGFMSARSPDESAHLVEAFRRGLKDEAGYVDFRFGDADLGLLSTLAADIVELRPDVIFAAAAGAASAARQRNRPTYRSSNQPSSSLSSTSRPRRPSASKFRRRSSRAPTR
jgi:putative ABC transport system substrate-binding protein